MIFNINLGQLFLLSIYFYCAVLYLIKFYIIIINLLLTLLLRTTKLKYLCKIN